MTNKNHTNSLGENASFSVLCYHKHKNPANLFPKADLYTCTCIWLLHVYLRVAVNYLCFLAIDKMGTGGGGWCPEVNYCQHPISDVQLTPLAKSDNQDLSHCFLLNWQVAYMLLISIQVKFWRIIFKVDL